MFIFVLVLYFLCILCIIRLRLGDTVTISALSDIKYAKSVSIAPFADTIEGISGDIFEVYVKPYFKDKYRPLKSGDMFVSRGGMRSVEFKVTGVAFADDSDQVNSVFTCHADVAFIQYI